MARIPAHIRAAREAGDPQAGFDLLNDSLVTVTKDGTNGLAPARELLNKIRRAGGYRKTTGEFKNPEKALKFYCNHYAKELGDVATGTKRAPARKTAARGTTRTATRAQAAPAASGLDPNMLVQLAQALGVQIPGMDTEVEDEDDDGIDTEVEGTPTRTTRRAPARTTRRVARTTAVEPEPVAAYPPPRDPDAPATQGKLWKLNAEGPDNGLYVCVIDEDGNILAGGEGPITAGEAYDLIGENIVS